MINPGETYPPGLLFMNEEMEIGKQNVQQA